MDAATWHTVMAALKVAQRQVCQVGGQEKNVQVPSTQVVAMHLWQVFHDRTLTWASDPSSYVGVFRPRRILSISQFSRRVKTQRVAALLQALHFELSTPDGPVAMSYFDGKLLPVALHSHDAEATKVRTNGGYIRGYRLHAYATEGGYLPVWSVTGAHCGEQTIARTLARHLPAMTEDALVFGDIRYDSALLYTDVANAGGALLTRLQAISQDPTKRRAMGQARLDAAQWWEDHPLDARDAMRHRDEIERIFSTLCCTAGGLAPLPAWVRTQDRVQRWVGIKIIHYHARLRLRQQRKQAA